MFVLLSFGTYLSALSARKSGDASELLYPRRTLHFNDPGTGQIKFWNWICSPVLFLNNRTANISYATAKVANAYLKYDSWNGKDTTILYGDTLRLKTVNTLATMSRVLPDWSTVTVAPGNPAVIFREGIYEFTVDYNGESITETINVHLQAHCTEDLKVTLKNRGAFVAVQIPSPYFTYQWKKDGVILADTTDISDYASDGTYTVAVTDMRTGCVGRDTLLYMMFYDISAKFKTAAPVVACDSSKWKFKADLNYYKKGDSLYYWNFDYGDGTSGTDSIHQYSKPGVYNVTVSMMTTNPWGASDVVTIKAGAKPTVTVEKVSGVQDTIYAHAPAGYHPSLFSVSWSRDGVTLPDSSWFIIPDDAGTYTVSIASRQDCKSSASVVYAPAAGFNYTPVNCDPQTISCTFVGATDGIQGYKWTVNGKVLSTEKNPVLKLDTGLNTVRVTATLSSGDTASVSKNINAEVWTLGVFVQSTAACDANAVLNAVTNAPAGKYFITWNKGINYQNDHIIADASGSYIATLKDSCGNIRAVDSVHLVLDQVMAPVIFKAGDTLRLESGIAGYNYSWFRNDSLVGTGTTAPYPTRSGIYQVKAFKTDSCYKISAPLTYIASGETLTASIVKTPSACGLNSYDFTVVASLPVGDSIVSYLWIAGKDTSRTNKLTVKLIEGGTIQSSVIIRTAYGLTSTLSESQVVKPLSWFVDRNGLSPCRDTAYLSAIVITPNEYKVIWDNTFAGNYYYAVSNGLHYVSVQDNCGNTYLRDSVEVDLDPLTPVIKINATADTIFCTPAATNRYTYSWNMGNVQVGTGNKSYLTNLQGGAIYSVTVSDSFCTKVSNTITVANNLVASFTITPEGCDSSVVKLDGSFSNVPAGDSVIGFTYDFGDGTSGNGQHLTRAYPFAGTYIINYTITTKNGFSAKSSRTFYSKGNVTGYLRLDTIPCTHELQLNFVQHNYAGKARIKWSTGDTSDSIMVPQAGTYTCYVEDSCGVVYQTLSYTVSSLPEVFKPEMKNKYVYVYIKNPSPYYTYKWYCNNVLLPYTESSTPELETPMGLIRVEVTDTRTGCVSVDTMTYMQIYAGTGVAKFTSVAPVAACDSSKWKFQSYLDWYKKADSLVSWKYTYGDGTTGTDSIHQYKTAGTYQVMVDLSTDGGAFPFDTMTIKVGAQTSVTINKVSGLQDTIFAHAPAGYDPAFFRVSWTRNGEPLPSTSWFIIPDDAGTYTVSVSSADQQECKSSASIVYAPGTGFNYNLVNCDPQTISCTFVGATDSVKAYNWTINAVTVSTEKNPVLKLGSGVNVVRVRATLASGDTTIAVKLINVQPWTLTAKVESIADCNVSAVLRATTNAPAGGYTITWNKGMGAAADSIFADTTATYIATLKDTCGNIRAVDSINLVLDQVITPVIFKAGDTLRVKSGNVAYAYSWFRNDTLVGTGTTAPYPTRSGIYKVKASGTDSCYKMSSPLTYIASGETLNYTITKLPSACGLNAIDFTVTPSLPYGDSVVSYLWIAGKDTSSTNTLTVKLIEGGTIQPVLTIQTAYGLTATVTESKTIAPLSFKVNYNGLNACRDTAYLSTIVNTPNVYNVVWDNSFVGNSYKVVTSGIHYVSLLDTCGNLYVRDSVNVKLSPFTPVIKINATEDTIFCTPNDTTVYTYTWKMGNVPVGVGNNAYLTDLQSGAIYGVTVSDSGCTKVANTIATGNNLTASFTITPDTCDSSVFTLAGTYENVSAGDSVISFTYDLGDGSTGNSQHLTKAYPFAGTYTINYTVTTKNGYTAKSSQTIYSKGNLTGYLRLDTIPCTHELRLSFVQNDAAAKAPVVKWSTGENGSSVIAGNAGTYTCYVENSCGYVYQTLPYTISSVPEVFKPTVKSRGVTIDVTNPSPYYTYRWFANGVEQADTTYSVWASADAIWRVEVTDTRTGCVGVDSVYYTLIYFDSTTAKFNTVMPVIACDSSKWKFKADVHYYEKGDTLISVKFDYGDGTSGTDSIHQYKAAGTYQVIVNAETWYSWGGSDTTSIKVVMPSSVTAEVIMGVQDTILAHAPAGYDPALFHVSWAKNGVTLPYTSWLIIPDGGGVYTVSVASQDGCTSRTNVTYKPVARAIVVPPAAGEENLNLSADFGTTTFNEDNEFTIELTVKDPAGKTLTETEVVTLGTVKSIDPSVLSVMIPATLPCASNYTVRVVSSSPADTTIWSGTFAIMNQPAQPVVTQVGDSLFTSSIYDLQWYKDDVAIPGATGAAIRARANGSYKVAAMNGESCSSISDARAVVITAVTNVSLGSNTVTVFPNPSEGPVYLKFAYPLTQQVIIRVYNSQGSVVYTTSTAQQQQLLDLSTLPGGFYIIEVTGNGSKKVLTIILQ